MKLLAHLCLCLLALPAFSQVPVISDVQPREGYPGQVISITGSNFQAGSIVTFGAVNANVISFTDQLLEVEVPIGATYDFITVTNTGSGLTGYSPLQFLPSFGGVPGLQASDFSAQTDLQVSGGLFDFCLCDLDGDGKPDLISTSSSANTIDILRNNSTPAALNFTQNSINVGARTLNATCGDLNGDGKPEVVLTEGADGARVFILTNNSLPGNLSLGILSYTITGSSTKRVAIQDMNRDGKPELIITDQRQPKVHILRNTSTGAVSFNTTPLTLDVPGATTTSGIAVIDFNRDRRPDILVTQFLTDNGGYFLATNASASGSFNFAEFRPYSATGALFNIIASDFNNDGQPDFAGTLFTSGAVSGFGNTTAASGNVPTFSSAQFFGVGQRPWGIGSGDLDGDGLEDMGVAKTGSELEVALLHASGGGGTFNAITIPVTYINLNIRLVDVNLDGKPDVVFTSADDAANGIPASKISILLNQKCYQPEIMPEGPFELCSGVTQRLSVQKVPGATYIWNLNGTPVKNGADNFIEAGASGNYTVTLNEVNGCAETSAPVSVTVTAAGALGTAIISANSPVCYGQTLTLESLDIGATTYEWTGPDNYYQTGRQVTVPNFRAINAGRYYLNIYVGTCLLQTTSIVVESNPVPDFEVISDSGATDFCIGETAVLNVSPSESGYTYQWYNQNGLISGATGTSHSVTQTGNYYVRATSTSGSCPPTDTPTLSINFVNLPIAAFDAPATACSNSEVTFTNQSTVTSTPSYFWEFGDGSTSTEASPKHIYSAVGTYTVTLTVNYGDATCQDQQTASIDITSGLNVVFANTNTTICEGQVATLSLTENFDTYLWSTGETTPTIEVDRNGTYTVRVTSGGGCEGINGIDITVSGLPNLTVTATPQLTVPGDPVQLTASGLLDYSWTPAEFLDDPTSPTPIAIVQESTLFQVQGTTENGCVASGEVLVSVSGDLIGNFLFPRNFFSPDKNDNINPVWIIEGIEEFPQCGVQIYDQTGNLLFETASYQNSWDGTTSSGQDLPDGAYYYIINCEGAGAVKSGTVTLLRN